MNNTDAHILLNAAKAGAYVTQAQILEALKATGDLEPIKRTDNEPIEVTHAVPAFAPKARLNLPKIVFEPWELKA